jgi:hypothetical protein
VITHSFMRCNDSLLGYARPEHLKAAIPVLFRFGSVRHRKVYRRLTFTFRQSQTQRTNLTAHTNHSTPFFERQLALLIGSFRATGSHAIEASHKALAQLSATVDLQATVLGYVNAFWLMSVAVACLIPFSRSPAKATRQPPRKLTSELGASLSGGSKI